MLKRWIRIATLAGAAFATIALFGAAAALGFRAWTPEDAARIAPLSDAYQDEALADARVTRAEYDTAIANAVACMREAGLDAHPVPGQAGGIGAFGNASEDQAAAGEGCIELHAARVSLTWAAQNAPDAAERAAALTDATACYAANGGAVTGTLSGPEIASILRDGTDDEAGALGPCLQANMEKYGFAW